MKAYSMKPSGVEWLGDVPEHWKVSQVKYAVDFHNNRRIPLSSAERGQMLDKTYDYYGASGVIDKVNDYIFNEPMILLGEDGANLLTRSKTLAFIATGKYWVNNHAHILHPKFGSLRFWAYLLESYDYSLSVTGAAQPKLNSMNLGRFVIVFTQNIKEQQAIADYLDQACKTIDQTIAVKKKQLETLGAYRKSVIHEAVTKGLDKDAPMKPSGEQVVGSIPKTWQIKRLKALSSIRYGLGQPPALKDDGLPLIRATNVKRGKISITGLIYIDPDDLPSGRDPYLKCEEIIVVRSGAYTADSAIIPKEWEGSITGYDMVVTAHLVEARFLAYTLLSKYVLTDQLLLMTLRAAQPHLNANELGSVLIAKPHSRKEQQAIADYLDQACNTIDQAKQVIEKQVNKLTQYRKSLIHECVTGKKRIYEGEVS